jgi:hypothetical protein
MNCLEENCTLFKNLLSTWNRVLEKLMFRSASQEITCLLWNPKIHCCVHKSPPPVTILTHINLVHIESLSFYKIHFNIVFPSMPRSSKWSLPFRSSYQNYEKLTCQISPMRATCHANLHPLDLRIYCSRST